MTYFVENYAKSGKEMERTKVFSKLRELKLKHPEILKSFEDPTVIFNEHTKHW